MPRPPDVVPVALEHAYRLINHGPTVLVSTRHGDRANLMAAAWNMPLDFSPPKVAVVIDARTLTRELIEGSGAFVLAVPVAAQWQAVLQAGQTSGRDRDKWHAPDWPAFAGDHVDAPLPSGCVAWLECRCLSEPEMARKYDLFLADVVAAWADRRWFRDGRWHLAGPDAPRMLHHIAAGHFFTTGGEPIA